MLLTDQVVAKLSIPDGKAEHIVFDDKEPGFGVRLRAGGRRVWIVQYRVGQKQRRVTIDRVDALSTAKARDRARALKANVTLGSDPQGERLAERDRAKTTLLTIVDGYLRAADRKVTAGSMKSASYQATERYLRQHWAPLHATPAHALTRREIASQLNIIAASNGPIAANRARAALSTVYSWAMREGLLETLQANPVAFTNKPADERHRDRVLSHDELREIWTHAGDGEFGKIVKLLALTGQRREEVGAMARSELRLDKALWSLPPARTKNGLAHDVPLAPAALELIKAVPVPPDDKPRDLLFGLGDGSFSGWSRAKRDLEKRIGDARVAAAACNERVAVAMERWTLHDLRRTFATLATEELGMLPHVVEAILNHVSSTESGKKGVAGVYNRARYAAEKRAALDAWAKHLAGIVKVTS